MATYLSFGPFIGFDYVIIMYSGVVLGGMGSILGAFWGGLTVGFVQQMLRPGAAAAIAERGDLRGVPADRHAASARPVRPLGGARMRAGRRRTAAPRRASRWSSSRSRYLAISCVRHQQLLPVDPDAGADLGGVRRVVEHPVRLWRAVVVRPRVVLRHRRLHRDAGAGVLEPHALARHSARHGRRRGRRGDHRHADIPPARPLFRAVDARLSAGDPLLPAISRLPGSLAADASGEPGGVSGVLRSAALHLVAVGPAGRRRDRLHAGGELALRPGAAGDPAERTGGRGGRHQRPALEDARAGRLRARSPPPPAGCTPACCWW